jgi:hypothetical protein
MSKPEAFVLGTCVFITCCGGFAALGLFLYIVEAFVGTGVYTPTRREPIADIGTIHYAGAIGIMLAFWIALVITLRALPSSGDTRIKHE